MDQALVRAADRILHNMLVGQLQEMRDGDDTALVRALKMMPAMVLLLSRFVNGVPACSSLRTIREASGSRGGCQQ